MSEEVVRLGIDGRMVGIFSGWSRSKDAPVALMFNAGYLHRVGPNRIWVSLARELAQKGIPSLRFDLGGLGDSRLPAEADRDYIKRAVDCVKEAMDFVESRLGKRDFIVYGLCSGADNAHRAALADPRIKAIGAIDSFGYETIESVKRNRSKLLKQRLRRCLSAKAWLRKLQNGFTAKRADSSEADAMMADRPCPPREQLEAEIQSLLKDNIRLHYVFTAGLGYFNHEKQFHEMYPAIKPQANLSCSYFGRADHTFSFALDRAKLIAQFVNFALAHK
jgi:hypothetical protein